MFSYFYLRSVSLFEKYLDGLCMLLLLKDSSEMQIDDFGSEGTVTT
jgi:hypothetical protein